MKKMNARRLTAFVQEFGFLEHIPGLDRVGKIKVACCAPSLLLKTGQITRSSRWTVNSIFYAVCGEKVCLLKSIARESRAPVGWEGDWRELETAQPIGDQIDTLDLTPDFIVHCDDHGGNWETWTIYKMDKFDFEAWCLDRRAELELDELEYNSEDLLATERRRDSMGY